MRSTSGSAGAFVDPVFVDRSGRRGRLVKRTGVVVSLLGLAYGVALVSLALIGVHINAPGLPLLEHSVRTVNGQADSHRTVGRPATETDRPKSTPTSKQATSPLEAAGANGAASRAGQPAPDQTPRGVRTDSQTATRVPAAADPAAAASPAAPGSTVSSVAPSSAPPSSAASAAAAPAAAPSSAAPSPTAALSPVLTKGKSGSAPGATRRATPANQSKSTEAPAASDRPTDPSQGNSADAPGASQRPTSH